MTTPWPPRGTDEALEESLQTRWNAQVVAYDRDRFPFDRWVLERVRAHGHGVDDLTTLHERLDPPGLYALTKALCADTQRPELRAMVDAFVRDEVAASGALEAPLAVQRVLNVRIMPPARPRSVFPFHTGLMYGHGPASRSVWMPLTDVRAPEDASASLHIIGLDRSRALIRQAAAQRLTVTEMQALFAADSRPLSAGPGQAVLFNQENLHGNFVNLSGKTRVSVDLRVAEARFGDRLARKPVGGYFRLLDAPQTALGADNDKPTVLYLNTATSGTRGAPVHLQRCMVLDYCKRHGVSFEFELFELDDMAHLPTLSHVVEGLGANAVLYSVYALPEDAGARARLFDGALAAGLVMHFVNEDLRLTGPEDREAIEAILRFARYGS
ncbi:MAG: hypothetical protein CSA66_04995 [Proteobacteria bacterium]|nr:MAG: hypothetical protein CSA66_04995 [Pseudomonadota bacterium]